MLKRIIGIIGLWLWISFIATLAAVGNGNSFLWNFFQSNLIVAAAVVAVALLLFFGYLIGSDD